ncbi:hypothetical protein K0504_06530 [Neiella marina]|uniref:Uncharacterized protein n=1 Tax=Neiella holothuriorum TaxID=2870530 RepID=A0ABS7EG59_9GAMM|nr:hypothetical protein [Neiella holothuriorum]MBW8190687.1 hypothetical protein [Neiella holothuriorum]
MKLALYSGLIAAVIGLIAFTLSWNLFDVLNGPLPGYRVLLFPGNLTLTYIWHPLFSEEVNFWPKLTMLLFGQFTVVSVTVGCIAQASAWFKSRPD